MTPALTDQQVEAVANLECPACSYMAIPDGRGFPQAPDSVWQCVEGIHCSETHVSLLGILNIPVLSLLTFSLIGVLLFFTHRMESS